jgi:hypothetical protein
MRLDTNRDRLERLMREPGESVGSPARVYLTGGVCAVLFGWRDMTLDVDLKADPEPAGFYGGASEVKEISEHQYRAGLARSFRARATRSAGSLPIHRKIRSDRLSSPSFLLPVSRSDPERPRPRPARCREYAPLWESRGTQPLGIISTSRISPQSLSRFGPSLPKIPRSEVCIPTHSIGSSVFATHPRSASPS